MGIRKMMNSDTLGGFIESKTSIAIDFPGAAAQRGMMISTILLRRLQTRILIIYWKLTLIYLDIMSPS